MPYGSSFNGMHLSRIDGHILGYKIFLSFYNQKHDICIHTASPKIIFLWLQNYVNDRCLTQVADQEGCG